MERVKFDRSELRFLMIRKYGTLSNFAKEAHLTNAYVSDLLNCKVELTSSKMIYIADILDIDNSEFGKYFFAKIVTK